MVLKSLMNKIPELGQIRENPWMQLAAMFSIWLWALMWSTLLLVSQISVLPVSEILIIIIRMTSTSIAFYVIFQNLRLIITNPITIVGDLMRSGITFASLLVILKEAQLSIILVILLMCFSMIKSGIQLLTKIATRLQPQTTSTTKYYELWDHIHSQNIVMNSISPTGTIGRDNIIYTGLGLISFVSTSLTVEEDTLILWIFILLYLIFNNKGKWNTLSSSFKYDSSKITILFFLLINKKSTWLMCIFLFETDRKWGNITHMLFVVLSTLHGATSHSLANLLCKVINAILFMIGDIACKQVENAHKNLVNSNRTQIEDTEFILIKEVKVYYNLPHYSSIKDFSSTCLLVELMLL